MSKREHTETGHGDKRMQRRDAKGRFAESDRLGRTLGEEQKERTQQDATRGEGDKGERKH